MRVLLAIDGSPSSEAACRVVGSLAWPAATSIRLVGVVPALTVQAGALAGMPVPEPGDGEVEATLRDVLTVQRQALSTPGRPVELQLLTGRPATRIVDEAAAWGADLIVVGSRGLGRVSSMVLGSVSAEVVDHAPCPVLVTRSPSIGAVLVAVDGSTSSRLALEHLALGYLADHPVEVLSVGPTHRSPVQPDAVAAQAAEELGRTGHRARWTISDGDPAHEILDAADQLRCDLIVVGSRGHTGLARLRLGSVARNVLLHTHASVLVVRGPVRVRRPETVEAATPQPVTTLG